MALFIYGTATNTGKDSSHTKTEELFFLEVILQRSGSLVTAKKALFG